jgi:hypothetical protein
MDQHFRDGGQDQLKRLYGNVEDLKGNPDVFKNAVDDLGRDKGSKGHEQELRRIFYKEGEWTEAKFRKVFGPRASTDSPLPRMSSLTPTTGALSEYVSRIPHLPPLLYMIARMSRDLSPPSAPLHD